MGEIDTAWQKFLAELRIRLNQQPEQSDDPWATAMERPSRPQSLEDVRKRISTMYPGRWRRLQGDYSWLQRKAKKYGLQEDDARFLL